MRAAGYECISLGDRVEGEARDVAAAHARLARELRAQGKRAVIMSGGELTVTIRGKGRGGPNQEYALALAMAIDGMPAIAALAADTDGTDGGGGEASDPAGAIVDGESVARARAPRPRSRRLSRRQQFNRLFRGTGRSVGAGADLHQRERFPRHRR